MTNDNHSNDLPMLPNRPYLLRALYEWIVDNQMTPHVLVDANVNGIQVPPSTIRNGKVVLNIDPDAVRNLLISNGELTCSARFGGVAQQLFVPVEAILAIYARENGRGMMFAEEVGLGDSLEQDETSEQGSDDKPGNKKRGHLQVVK